MWPNIEIGVGLIACNLPSLSFRVAQVLPKQIQRGWSLSLSGIRHAMATLSLKLDLRSHTDRHLANTDDDGATSDWYQSRRRSPGYLEQQGSAATISNLPLVHVGPMKDNVSSETRPAGAWRKWPGADRKCEQQEQVVRGFDAV